MKIMNKQDTLTSYEENQLLFNEALHSSSTVQNAEHHKEALITPSIDLLVDAVGRASQVVESILHTSTDKLKIDSYIGSVVPNLTKIEVALQFIEQNNIDISQYSKHTPSDLKSLLEKLATIDKKIWSDYRLFLTSLKAKHTGEEEKPMGSMSDEIEELFGDQDFGSQIGALNG